jgi:hypothetical protein
LPAADVAMVVMQSLQGTRDAAGLDVLGRLLAHPDTQLSAAAAQCLNTSQDGVARRLAMLDSPDVEVRRVALRHVRMGRASQATAAEHARLLTALEDPDAWVRAGVARWLATWRGWSGWSYETGTWSAPPEQRRALARAALDLAAQGVPGDLGLAVQLYVDARVPLPGMLPVLLGLLGDASDLVQPATLANAFALTSEWVEAPVVAELVKSLEAPEMVRRADAALVLASLRQEQARVLAALPGLLAHPSARILRRGVATALHLGPAAAEVAPALLRSIEADQPVGIGHEGVPALLAVAPEAPETLAALRRWLKEPQRHLRHSLPGAIFGLGRAGVPLLVEGLDLDAPIAAQCLSSLQRLGRAAADALPALRERAARRPDDQALAAAIAAIEGT